VRIETPDAVGVDGDALKRGTLLRAVAVAAGRASPETVHERVFEPRPAACPPTIDQARAEGRLILVAEDDSVNQKVLLRQLALLGYAAEVASNGAQALALWRVGHHDLLLTDLHMPELDGYAVSETIRREEAASASGQRARIPIIALTANALRDEASRVRAAGMDEYLTKPIQLHVLEATLKTWLPRAGTPAPHAMVDIAVLKELVGDDDPDALQELLSDYLISLRQQAAQLRAACATEDFRQVGNIAHKLKSSSRAVGALAFAELCAELENLAQSNSKANIVRSTAQLDAALQEVAARIAHLLAPQTA
jgi:CheY-like chemotaxis protein